MKKLLVILVVASFAVPLIAAEDEKGLVKCYVIGHGKFLKIENEITIEEANKIIEKVQKVIDLYKKHGEKDFELTNEEKIEIENAVNDAIAEIRKAGLLPEKMDAKELGLLPHFGIAILNPIVSIGAGCSHIPLYPGEAFIGFMLRPIFVHYFYGYTGCINFRLIPPRLEYWDWFGTQTFMILGFAGIYIDFASIGFGFPPMQVIMGESFLTAGIDWI